MQATPVKLSVHYLAQINSVHGHFTIIAEAKELTVPQLSHALPLRRYLHN
jgi:hypothetical protein